MKSTDPSVREALADLAVKHKLDPVDVVAAARAKSSPLHDFFTWDNTEAAEQYRLIEARKLIQVHVDVLPGMTESVQTWVSLRSDRSTGGGYRTIATVMSRKELRDMLLKDALSDLDTWRKKYATLKELAVVFAAHDKLKNK